MRNQLNLTTKAETKGRERLFESLVAQAQARRVSRHMGQRFQALEALQQAAAIAKELKLPAQRFDTLRDESIACLALPDMKETGWDIPRPPGMTHVAFDSTMTRYALRFRNGTIQVRRVSDDEQIAHFQARGDLEIFVFGMSPDGRYLATTHQPGGALTVWDIDRGTAILNEPGDVVVSKFNPDTRRIAVGRRDGEVRLFDVATGQPVHRWPGPAQVQDLAFRGDGGQIAVTYWDRKDPSCRIMETQSGRLVRSIGLPFIATVAWSPDGSALATPGDDGKFSKIYLWDAATGTRKATLEGTANGGLHAAFHPAGTVLASHGWQGRLRLWDPVLGRPWLSLAAAMSPDFSADGRIVVVTEEKMTSYHVDPALEYRTLRTWFSRAADLPAAVDPERRPDPGRGH